MPSDSPVHVQADDDPDTTPQNKDERVMLARFAAGYSGEHWVTGAQEQTRRDSRSRNRRARASRRLNRRRSR
jgi:hypothetical protein